MADLTDSSSQTVRLAMLGCGQIGRVHLQRCIVDPRAKIVALCDPVLAAAEKLRDEFAPGAAVCQTLDALLDPSLLDGEPLDGVIVCTPTHQHYEQVLAIRARGMAVLCEKPLADSRARIVQLIESAQHGPLLSLAYQRRYQSTFRTLRRELQSGRWGAVKSVTTHGSERWQQTIGNTWRDDPKFNPGGFLGDAGSHKLDILFFITGLRPQEVFAHSDRRGSHVEIVTTLSAKLTGNVALSMNFIGDANHWREDLHFHCADADLNLRDGMIWIGRDNTIEKLEDLEPESNPNIAFLDCLTQGAPNIAPADCALPVWDFTQAVLESARTRRLVELTPAMNTEPSAKAGAGVTG